MDSSMELPDKIKDKNVIFVIDNQPRNRDVVETLQDLIKRKFNVVIWPNNIKEKDINDMVLSGKTSDQIIEIIKQNTYNGLQAQLKLNEWKKT
jgi:disulfide oxidoreductase YuzD